MSPPDIYALGFGFLLGIIHFYSEKLKPPDGANRYRVISFAAGISIAYLFLNLLPHTYEAAGRLKNFVFVFLLLGFVLFHLAEKFIYKHADKKKLAQELKEVHSVSFFLYHFVIGIVLYDKAHLSGLEGVLFFIPIALHASLSTASLSEIHGDIRESRITKILLSLSTLFGVIFALLVPIPTSLDNIFVSVIAGILLYIIVKEFLPEKDKGQPMFFLFGLLLFIGFYVILEFMILD
jgi:zinc transporter ZupT